MDPACLLRLTHPPKGQVKTEVNVVQDPPSAFGIPFCQQPGSLEGSVGKDASLLSLAAVLWLASCADVCPRRRIATHVHSSQINPNAQLDALYAAEKAAAQREAARTQKKLSEFASKLLRPPATGHWGLPPTKLGSQRGSHETSCVVAASFSSVCFSGFR